MSNNSALPVLQATPNRLPAFANLLRERGLQLARTHTETVQINVGKLCNQACQHCHVGAGPKRTEIMSATIAERIIELLRNSPSIATVDITGGAPELNEHFRMFVRCAKELGKTVIDRCNLTVLFEARQEDLPEFLASYEVQIVASLPCYTRENVDKQRGGGVFEKSIKALQRLNAIGYGSREHLPLHLMFNPVRPSLPPPQARLEADYKQRLMSDFGIVFNQLFTLTNMPIERFRASLARSGKLAEYERLLLDHFNPATIAGLMCRSTVSVSWDGRLYDCDFNQMIGLPMPGRSTIWDIGSFSSACYSTIATAPHCFGCTAGAGSSCGGALEPR